MDPIEKLAEALEAVHNVDATDANAGGSIIAGYEAIRTYSLAAIAHELHHARHELEELRKGVEEDGVTVFVRPDRLVRAVVAVADHVTGGNPLDTAQRLADEAGRGGRGHQ